MGREKEREGGGGGGGVGEGGEPREVEDEMRNRDAI